MESLALLPLKKPGGSCQRGHSTYSGFHPLSGQRGHVPSGRAKPGDRVQAAGTVWEEVKAAGTKLMVEEVRSAHV